MKLGKNPQCMAEWRRTSGSQYGLRAFGAAGLGTMSLAFGNSSWQDVVKI